jgi:hypothetical protein
MKKTFIKNTADLRKEFNIPAYTINYCVSTGKLPKGSYSKETNKHNSTYMFTQEGVDALVTYIGRK